MAGVRHSIPAIAVPGTRFMRDPQFLISWILPSVMKCQLIAHRA